MQSNLNLNEKYNITGLVQDGKQLIDLNGEKAATIFGVVGAGIGLAKYIPTWLATSSKIDDIILNKLKPVTALPCKAAKTLNMLGLPIKSSHIVAGVVVILGVKILIVALENNEMFREKFMEYKIPQMVALGSGIALIALV